MTANSPKTSPQLITPKATASFIAGLLSGIPVLRNIASHHVQHDNLAVTTQA